MVFFTSDLHLGHQKNFLYEPRGFSSIEEHDDQIIKNWNSIVTPADDVYILGDMAMGTDVAYYMDRLGRLNGNIHFIRGNHDTDTKVANYKLLGWEELGYATMLKYHKYHFYLSHYPAIVSNYDIDKPLNQRVINLCGHCHTQDRFKDMDKGLIYHVELDAHNCTPVSVESVLEDIKNNI